MKQIAAPTLAAVILASANAGAAEVACYPLAHIEQALGTQYGETRRFSGKEGAGIEYRLYVNSKTGTWSWVGIPPKTEIGCLIFAGAAKDQVGEGDDRAPQPNPAADAVLTPYSRHAIGASFCHPGRGS
jgi:hypothetical protein